CFSEASWLAITDRCGPPTHNTSRPESCSALRWHMPSKPKQRQRRLGSPSTTPRSQGESPGTRLVTGVGSKTHKLKPASARAWLAGLMSTYQRPCTAKPASTERQCVDYSTRCVPSCHGGWEK